MKHGKHGHPFGPPHRPPLGKFVIHTILKLLILGGLIYKTAKSLLCDCALNNIGSQMANGTNLMLRAAGPHVGFTFPMATEICLFFLKN